MDCGERRKGGAVSDARSPLNVASDYKPSVPTLLPMGLSASRGVSMSRTKGVRTLMNEKKALLWWGASFSDSHLVDMTRVCYLR